MTDEFEYSDPDLERFVEVLLSASKRRHSLAHFVATGIAEAARRRGSYARLVAPREDLEGDPLLPIYQYAKDEDLSLRSLVREQVLTAVMALDGRPAYPEPMAKVTGLPMELVQKASSELGPSGSAEV